METKIGRSIVDGSFVERAFYTEPPGKGAAPEAWEAWLKAEALAKAAHKRAHTKSLRCEEIPEHLRPRVLSKVGGVYRQSALVGFVGGEENTSVEVAIDADQDRRLVLSRQVSEQKPRGTKSGAKNARHKANAKAKRRAARARRFN